MRHSLLSLVRCPDCSGALSLKASVVRGDQVLFGELDCAGCGAEFPVLAGVPSILRSDARSKRTRESFGKQWQMHSRGGFERDTIYSKSRAEGLADFQKAFSLRDFRSLGEALILDA